MSQREQPLKAYTNSAEATRSLARTLAGLARPSDLILIAGDLGAGKTVFVQGFGTGLEIEDRITSPTFALVQSYEGRLRMHHLDVYRIIDLAETADLGLAELLDDNAVTLIEWGDTITGALPRDYLQIGLTQQGSDDPESDGSDVGEATDWDWGSDDARTLRISPVGAAWRARMTALSAALAPWLVPTGEEQC